MSKIKQTVTDIINSTISVPFGYEEKVAQVVARIEEAAYSVGDNLLATAEAEGFNVERVKAHLIAVGLQPEPVLEPEPEPEPEVEEPVAEEAGTQYVTKADFDAFSTQVTEVLERLTALAQRHLGADL